MWPAFNSFVVLLPCGKKGADGSPVGEGRVPLRLDEEGRGGGDVHLCIRLFVCSTEEFFFLQFSKLFFSFKNNLSFLSSWLKLFL